MGREPGRLLGFDVGGVMYWTIVIIFGYIRSIETDSDIRRGEEKGRGFSIFRTMLSLLCMRYLK